MIIMIMVHALVFRNLGDRPRAPMPSPSPPRDGGWVHFVQMSSALKCAYITYYAVAAPSVDVRVRIVDTHTLCIRCIYIYTCIIYMREN